NLFYGEHCRIETLHVSYLQDSRVPLRAFDQLIRLIQGRRHRLFHQYIYSLLHYLAANFRMSGSWNLHPRRVHRTLQLAERSKSSRFKFCRELFRARSIGIKNSDEIRAFHLSVYTRVITAELSAADYGHTNSFVLRGCAHSLFIPFAAALGSATTG